MYHTAGAAGTELARRIGCFAAAEHELARRTGCFAAAATRSSTQESRKQRVRCFQKEERHRRMRGQGSDLELGQIEGGLHKLASKDRRSG